VGRLGHGRRAGYALQGDPHLLGDGEQARADDLVDDRIDGGASCRPFPRRLPARAHDAMLTCRLPKRSALATPRGGMTTLWPGNSMIAGPFALLPGGGNVVR